MPNNELSNNDSLNKKKFNRGYIIGLMVTFVIDLVTLGLVILYETQSLKMSIAEETFVILSDAFTIAGGFTCLLFLLLYFTGEGAFDAVIYGIKLAFFTTFYKNIRETKIPSTYAEYRALKRSKEKKSFSFMIIVGGLFLLIGIILLIPFNKSI